MEVEVVMEGVVGGRAAEEKMSLVVWSWKQGRLRLREERERVSDPFFYYLMFKSLTDLQQVAETYRKQR